jgi:hypothetical protein
VGGQQDLPIGGQQRLPAHGHLATQRAGSGTTTPSPEPSSTGTSAIPGARPHRRHRRAWDGRRLRRGAIGCEPQPLRGPPNGRSVRSTRSLAGDRCADLALPPWRDQRRSGADDLCSLSGRVRRARRVRETAKAVLARQVWRPDVTLLTIASGLDRHFCRDGRAGSAARSGTRSQSRSRPELSIWVWPPQECRLSPSGEHPCALRCSAGRPADRVLGGPEPNLASCSWLRVCSGRRPGQTRGRLEDCWSV